MHSDSYIQMSGERIKIQTFMNLFITPLNTGAQTQTFERPGHDAKIKILKQMLNVKTKSTTFPSHLDEYCY